MASTAFCETAIIRFEGAFEGEAGACSAFFGCSVASAVISALVMVPIPYF
jgi:hypothetical protein